MVTGGYLWYLIPMDGGESPNNLPMVPEGKLPKFPEFILIPPI